MSLHRGRQLGSAFTCRGASKLPAKHGRYQFGVEWVVSREEEKPLEVGHLARSLVWSMAFALIAVWLSLLALLGEDIASLF
jgi:hypothetical protein